jgi:methyltransferase
VTAVGWIVGLIVLSRLAELFWSARTTRQLLARGGFEAGAGQYQYFVLLHVAWLATVLFVTPPDRATVWPLVGVLALLQFARIWTIISLGAYWTTKVVVVPHQPDIRKGPYAIATHPAYLIASLEIAVLPLAFGEIIVAAVFVVLNTFLLAWRVRVEDEALAIARRPA